MLNYPLKTNPYTPKKWTFPTLQAAAFQRTSLQLFGLLGEISSKIFATFSPKREPLNPGSSSRAISLLRGTTFSAKQTSIFEENSLWGYFSGAAARQQNSPELADCSLILSINSSLSIPRTLVLGCFHCVPPCHVIWRLSRAIHSIIPYISDFPPRSTTRSIAVSDETCRRLYPVRYTMRRAFLESLLPPYVRTAESPMNVSQADSDHRYNLV